jgi:glycosyltransferase involved in cell wall biosynthesis
MIKVCHIISGYHRTDARIFQRQCKSLVNAGFEVSLLTNDCKNEEIIDGIKIFTCRNKWGNRLKIILFAKKQFYEDAINVDADIYQLHSPELIGLGIELQKKNKKVVYDAHEDLPKHILEKEWIPYFLRRPLSFVIEKYMNSMLFKYDAIVSPHSHVVDYLSKINPNVSMIANFPLIQNRNQFTLEDYLGRGKRMCYTGTVYSYSNQEEILDAINNLDGVSYHIPGYFNPEHLKSLKKRDGFSKLRFLGRLSSEEMVIFYNQMALGVVIYNYMLNLGNRLGSYGTNKIFEYMEAGIPFICTDYILWKEIVEQNNCGICVEPGNREQIENAIKFLIDNPLVAYQMGQNGRNAVVKKYNWRSQEKEYVNLFNKLKTENIN